MHRSFALLTLIALNGCATNFESEPLPAGHPATVQAQEAPRSGMKRLIMTDELTRQTNTQLARKEVPNPDFQSSRMSHDVSGMGGMQHDMSRMEGMDHSKMPGMDMNKPPASSPAQEPAKTPGMDHSKMKEMPMPTASVTASAADKEPVEGEMKKLSDEMKAKSDAAKSDKKKPVASKATPAAAVYTCTMHPEINLPAPGKCPKCGMTLVKKESGAK
jgi:hypothetical protein